MFTILRFIHDLPATKRGLSTFVLVQREKSEKVEPENVQGKFQFSWWLQSGRVGS
jgi:hypothetical protein